MSVLSDLYPRRLVSIGLRVCSSQISDSGDGFRCECLLRENVKMRIVKCHLSCQLKYEKIDHYQVLLEFIRLGVYQDSVAQATAEPEPDN